MTYSPIIIRGGLAYRTVVGGKFNGTLQCAAILTDGTVENEWGLQSSQLLRGNIMGAYIYKINPSQVVNARVRFKDGTIKNVRVGRYQYAYKPYWSDEHNRELYKRYIVPSKMAWAKSGQERPTYGVLEDSEHVFTTGKRLTINDEAIGLTSYGPKYVGEIIPWDATDNTMA